MNYNNTFQDCYVHFTNNRLVIGNDAIERVWGMLGDIPVALSLINKRTGKEWFIDYGEPVPSFMKRSMVHGPKLDVLIASDIDNDLGVSTEYLRVIVTIEYISATVTWTHIIYPDVPVMRLFFTCKAKTHMQSIAETKYEDKSDNLEIVNKDITSSPLNDDYIDYFPLDQKHRRWKSIQFNDKTDYYNNLIKTDDGLFYDTENLTIQGNLLFINELTSDEGVLIIKEGPTPHAYQGGMKKDFRVEDQKIFSCGWGFTTEELNNDIEISSYGSAVVLWNGCEDQSLIALQNYHRAIHKISPDKDSFLMSNTWGDRSQDKCISEEFILKELELAARLGITIYQIDDGWQKGITANSALGDGVWDGFHESDPDFWNVNNSRFPKGLKVIVESAQKKGVKLGLWFSPDSTDDFINWKKDADVLFKLYERYSILSFKLDGIKIKSKTGEENLTKMMQRVVLQTNGNVFFNLDVTAETRCGYYGRVQYGCLFLENRYTDWHNYYPHWTLRNLWMLSGYYPTYRLQIEFLNVKRNTHLYTGDILSPASCGIEYAFAVTMFANPLCWMELTGLDEESVTTLTRVINIYRKYQAVIHSGYVFPIGDEPSGLGWTGFHSIVDKHSGFLLIIKELNSLGEYYYDLKSLKGKQLKLELLLGSGSQEVVEVNTRGSVGFELKNNFQYSLYRYTTI